MRCLEDGKTLLVDMDVHGVRQVRKILKPEEMISIYIDGGGWGELERRIRSRAPITEDELVSRKRRFEYEKEFKSEADFIVENREGKLEEAKKEFEDIINTLVQSA